MRRLAGAVDAYGLSQTKRFTFVAMIDLSMACGEDFVNRKLAGGNANFVRMVEMMGGAQRLGLRRAWFEEQRPNFPRPFALSLGEHVNPQEFRRYLRDEVGPAARYLQEKVVGTH